MLIKFIDVFLIWDENGDYLIKKLLKKSKHFLFFKVKQTHVASFYEIYKFK